MTSLSDRFISGSDNHNKWRTEIEMLVPALLGLVKIPNPDPSVSNAIVFKGPRDLLIWSISTTEGKQGAICCRWPQPEKGGWQTDSEIGESVYSSLPNRLGTPYHTQLTRENIKLVRQSLDVLFEGMLARFSELQAKIQPILDASSV